MLLRAKEKLEAARYFLEQMTKSLQDRKRFIYNLDAFLSISRSVTFVLQSEFSSNYKFQEWYTVKQEKMRNDSLMTFFKDMRNITVKEGTPQTKAEAYISLKAGFNIKDSVSIKLKGANGTEELFEPLPTGDKKEGIESIVGSPVVSKYFFLENTDSDIISLCTQYIEKLTNIVLEARMILE